MRGETVVTKAGIEGGAIYAISAELREAIAKLAPVAVGLLQETAFGSGRPLSSLTPNELARLINDVPIKLAGIAPISRAISTAGGIRLDELDSISRCGSCRACSRPAKCSTGRRRPAATSCRPVLPPAPRRAGVR